MAFNPDLDRLRQLSIERQNALTNATHLVSSYLAINPELVKGKPFSAVTKLVEKAAMELLKSHDVLFAFQDREEVGDDI